MKKLSIFLSLILSLVIVLCCVACKGSQIMSFTAFNTTIRIEAHDKKISSKTADELTELFSSLEKRFDKNQQSSTVYEFNSAPAQTPISLGDAESELFALAREYYDFSGGLFNPAVAPLTALWQFDNFGLVVDFVPPADQKIQEILNEGVVDFNKVKLEAGQAYKTSDQVKIDLGGLAKGYAVDKALEIMIKAGHASGYINVGNSSMALLNVKSLNVSHPRASGQSILTVHTESLFNTTLSTSGDYERYFEYGGKRYSHIIDPATGYPVNTGIASATVIGITGAFTDAITTALCICEHTPTDFDRSPLVQLMKKIVANYPDSKLFIVYEKDGAKQLITNEKQGESFTLLDNNYVVKNI